MSTKENNPVRNDESKDSVSNGTGKSEAAQREEKVLEFWRENKTFEKSLTKDAPKGNYVFYDGPPFATGTMHYGHILGSTAKDVIGRYQTMLGYHVPRKWGWDCHGLPIEHLVEKELKIAGHVEIEKLGIDKFVEYARSKVLQFDKEWEVGVERIGRWVDFEKGYKTMDNTFMESVWWALSEMNKKDLVYEGVRVLAYCARCETPIANSEIAMDNSYKDITDISVYVKFELEDEPGTYLLAWTTTPWTLPGNTAIAVNKDIDYVKVIKKSTNEKFVLSLDEYKKGSESVLAKSQPQLDFEMLGNPFKGSELVGKKYRPIFPYYSNSEVAKNENIWKVWHADFVTTEKGTGMAHEAPAFGEDDMNMAKEHNVPWIIHVDETGRFKPEVTDFAGMKVKPKPEVKDEHQKADIEVIKWLAHQNPTPLFAKEKIVHSYPHCMRCDTPIIYYALPSWFINIQKAKSDILKSAESMTWVPAHLKEGRFKHIAENAPDWNISRNRYWATPLPIWKCESCNKIDFVSSLDDLKTKAQKSGNKYFVMRHGQTDNNVKNLVSTMKNSGSHLTEEGKVKTKESAEGLKDKGIDLVITSPFNRTRETTEIVKEVLGLSDDQIVEDERLGEMQVLSYEGRTWDEYHSENQKIKENFDKSAEGDESYKDIKRRVMEFIFETEEKYKDKNVLIVTHGGPAWLLASGALMLDIEKTLNMISEKDGYHYLSNSEVQELNFFAFPHNHNYELDLHRPYIDEVKVLCSCGGVSTRVPEVLDCWFESGSMPFAQDHFPFENPDWQKNNFPAGFVAEYIAQTRTWFYYSHVVSTILFGHAPYKNVVTTGTVRAEDGQKMSKSKNNFPDPNILFNKYGVDALRIYLMSSPLMKGEDANFSEKLVQEISSKFVGRLFNVVSFYELYRDKELESDNLPSSANVLDQWILSRLNQVIEEMTKWMNAYEMALAIAPLDKFIDDLSTWYLRRSRDRIKDGDKDAKQTMYFVLKNLVKVMAPFAPFCAESEWQKLRKENDPESVHLTEWPKTSENNNETNVLSNMQVSEMNTIRGIVREVLDLRQKANIKVRQPLGSITLRNKSEINSSLLLDYVAILQDELNVKDVFFDEKQNEHVVLDTNITPELKQEGDYRELVRGIQDMRKAMGLVPSDVVHLLVSTNTAGEELINKFKTELLKVVGASGVEFGDNDGTDIKVDELSFKVKLNK